MPTIPAHELRRLRNDVPVAAVIHQLGLRTARRGTRHTFQCPGCRTFHTAVNPRTNLARCFRCGRNYNSIDLIMAVSGSRFLDAVRYLGAEIDSASQNDATGSPESDDLPSRGIVKCCGWIF